MPEEPIKMTHVAREEDEFAFSASLIFQQADFVEKVRVGSDDKALASLYLVFSRRVKIDAPEGYTCDANGFRWGEELVAYSCDEAGRVCDWSERAVMRGPNYVHARAKLTLALENHWAHWEYAPKWNYTSDDHD